MHTARFATVWASNPGELSMSHGTLGKARYTHAWEKFKVRLCVCMRARVRMQNVHACITVCVQACVLEGAGYFILHSRAT